LVNICIPVKVTGIRHRQNLSVNTNYRYCCSGTSKRFVTLLHAVLLSSTDVICLGFKFWASGSMVLVLHRTQAVSPTHSQPQTLPRPDHESRTTCTILILVSMFVLFYCLSSTLNICVTLIGNSNQWLMCTSVYLATCLPALSPFVLISSDTSSLSDLWFLH
jgi:vomeronasal1 receptor